MSISLENFIVFALVLNILGFIVYALSFYKKKVNHQVPVETDMSASVTEEEKGDGLLTEEGLNEAQRLVDELKAIQAGDYKVEKIVQEVKPPAEYEKEFEENIKAEQEKIKKDFAPPKKEETATVEEKTQEDETPEPFELLSGMDVEPIEEEVVVPKEEISYSIDKDSVAEEKDEKKEKREYIEPKREVMDSVDILKVEGKEEEEEEQDEIVVRHFEPYVYQMAEEVEEEEQKDEKDEIEKRIAYLTGEWTEDYVIQPKQNKNDGEKKE